MLLLSLDPCSTTPCPVRVHFQLRLGHVVYLHVVHLYRVDAQLGLPGLAALAIMLVLILLYLRNAANPCGSPA